VDRGHEGFWGWRDKSPAVGSWLCGCFGEDICDGTANNATAAQPDLPCFSTLETLAGRASARKAAS
jgi:hypothetical protein